MTALLPDDVLRLGDWEARFQWADAAHPAALPAAVVISHAGHDLVVPWAGEEVQVFTLDSLLPLTVVERVRCSMCGVEGRIEQGAWLPSKGGKS